MSGRGNTFRQIFGFGTALFLLVFGSSVNADIFRYIDENGVMHFTNTPTSNVQEYKLYIKEKTTLSRNFYAPDKYDRYISDASAQTGVDSRLLKAMIKAESDFNPRAISRKGAMGLMQIMPENFKMLDLENPFDPWQNIRAGARYFQQLYERFNGKLALSLAAYNAGPTAVDRYKTIPPYKETEEYVRRVLRYYRTFKQL
ncbi:MAG: lytic transglycosylase domain-containing protein [Desulfobacterales bacterium]|nr:lytic transglycosylase domain-containing protein [Desulfobacterales bacterium]